jgi:sugar diacid utilization regulator
MADAGDDMTIPDRPPGLQRRTLGRLVESLGGSMVDLLASPGGLDVEVLGPRIYDPLDPAALGPGELVLGINVAPTEAGLLLRASAAAGAAAVAVKGDRSTLAAAIPDAQAQGMALLAVSPATTWDQLYGLIQNAVEEGTSADTEEPPPLRDLFAVANALAAVVGGAVTIEDANFNLLAYSNLDQPIDGARRDTILGRGLPGDWARRLEEMGILLQLSSTQDAVVRIDDPTGQTRPRLAASIRAGAEVLGSVWAVEGNSSFGPESEAALRQAMPLLALRLLRQRGSDDLTRRERGALLRSLLDGDRTTRDLAAGLGIDVDSPCAIVAFRLTTEDDLDLSVKRARAVDLISVACEAFRRRVVCSWIGQTVYALFPSLGADSTARLVSMVGTISDRSLHSLGSPLYAGVGSTVAGLEDVHRSRDEADRVVRVLMERGLPGRTAAAIDDVRVPGILIELGDVMRERPHLRLPVVESIARYDADHSKNYLDTLRAYVAAYCDVTKAGAALTLHPNTVRYRIRRLEELFGLDLSDPEHLLVISLQFLGGTV